MKTILFAREDVKELIPEFYDTSKAGDFLVNTQNLFFGVTQDHSLVDDVVLPPWSKGPRVTLLYTFVYSS
jgi:hypothetical protein